MDNKVGRILPYPLLPAWILPLIFYHTFSFQISIHLSIPLSTYQFILLFDTFQSKLETSVHFPLSTSTWMSLKFNSLLFFFGCKIYIQYAQVLSVYLLNFEKCMYLYNQTPVKIRTFTHTGKFLSPIPCWSLLPLSSPSSSGQPLCCFFSHHRLDLPVLEMHVSGIIEFVHRYLM